MTPAQKAQILIDGAKAILNQAVHTDTDLFSAMELLVEARKIMDDADIRSIENKLAGKV